VVARQLPKGSIPPDGKLQWVCEECGGVEQTAGAHPGCQCELKIVTCHRCKRPILSGEARYTAGEYRGLYSHHDCKKVDDALLDERLRKTGEAGVALANMLKRWRL
jgi:hypothetical protein